MESENPPASRKSLKFNMSNRWDILWEILLVIILAAGAFLRITGVNWDDNHHLHPDERFLTMVETSLQPVDSIREYFDTANSTLNPNNVGHGFFVYGTLPIFLVRMAAGWLDMTGYDSVFIVGRYMSALADLLTVLLVYLIGRRLYKSTRLGVLAAAFSAASVLQIQLSHYFAVDTFATLFTYLAFYFAVGIAMRVETTAGDADEKKKRSRWMDFLPYAGFGLALGAAMASKVSVAPAALLLPLAAVLHHYSQPKETRDDDVYFIYLYLVCAGIIAFFAFRIFQPYAFSGPGFFGIGLNPQWVANMQELAHLSQGDVDFPPALQWARRPVTFALVNMVRWGMGFPLGILAWAGFAWMGWKIFRGQWREHILLWAWTGVFFAMQSINANPMMRYTLPVYPSLAIIAAWALVALTELRFKKPVKIPWNKILAAFTGVTVLAGTFLWAFGFVEIYNRPVTRVEASRWIYDTVPAAITIPIQSDIGTQLLPVAYPVSVDLYDRQPLTYTFTAQESGWLSGIVFPHISRQVVSEDQREMQTTLETILSSDQSGMEISAYQTLQANFAAIGELRGEAFTVSFANPAVVQAGHSYTLSIRFLEAETLHSLYGPPELQVTTTSGVISQFLPEPVRQLKPGSAWITPLYDVKGGKVSEISLNRIADLTGTPGEKTLRISIIEGGEGSPVLASGLLRSEFLGGNDLRGSAYVVSLNRTIELARDRSYSLVLEFVKGEGSLGLFGSRIANESSWDDGLPLPMEGYNPYDLYQGLYRTEYNFELYWDDNTDKLARFQSILDQTDYIFISSNRQWGTTTRIPERYPLTVQYYRSLLGCPAEKDLLWCYAYAQPGMFKGSLGFDLVYVQQSEPTLGGLSINTQPAEEAFTVYDHPKVLVFKKNETYNPQAVRSILSSVDLSRVIHLTPKQAGSYKGNLMLNEKQSALQQAGGTWSELFNVNALQNTQPWVGLALWYVTLLLLGWVMIPFLRLALPGLADHGYPLARLVGMLVLALLVWLAGSIGIGFTRITITAVIGLLVAVNGVLAALQWNELKAYVRRQWRDILIAEAVFLVFFMLDVLIRYGNPDLWHPYKGGEKPMDFSYFNAVLKSTVFPPYDPWFAGGYINYYYYGYVIVGVLVKWLGIVPSIAYNFILPTLFAAAAAGAFCFGRNLFAAQKRAGEGEEDASEHRYPLRAFAAGLAAAMAMVFIGNLGTVRMILQGWQRLAAPGGMIEQASLLERLTWTIKGLSLTFTGTHMPYSPGDWYWIPSRAFPNEPITEFPFFTFLYGDLHAHMIALPITVLVLVWALAIIKGRWQWNRLRGTWVAPSMVSSLLLAGIAIGALRPTNTWDLPTYFLFAGLVLAYTFLRYGRLPAWFLAKAKPGLRKWAGVGAILAVFIGTALVLYQPYVKWYAQGYNMIKLWDLDRTPLGSYLIHWGLFIFLIVSWLVWETHEWLATTPVSALKKLKPYENWIIFGAVALVVIVLLMLVMGVHIAWLVLPLIAWTLVMMARPGLPETKRIVLFMVATGLALTLMVELIVLVGDIGRMNTVFKFYLQAWTLLSISAAAGMVWTYPAALERWNAALSNVWQMVLAVLICSVMLYPFTAGIDKISDRIDKEAPHSFDGMTYMAYAEYFDENTNMDLSQDYRAIRWMQENVQGSPVIVEANMVEYHWGTRYTVYTGLPGVVGWNWHQRQQRGVVSTLWVEDRVAQVGNFYNSLDRSEIEEFLDDYKVQYIVVGQLERALYSLEGMMKFDILNGDLWDEVYRDQATVIYRVR